MDRKILINNFATRSFRNTADYDYIAARLCYRNYLIDQFNWQALQAIEKYLKAILLYNRIKAKKVGHDLSVAMELTSKLPFNLELTKSTVDLINHLNTFGQSRYLEISSFTHGYKLVELDQAVWEIRRYCRVLNHDKKQSDGSSRNMLDIEMDIIKNSSSRSPHEFKIIGGELEKIIKKEDHPSRKALLWQNAFFATRRRKKVKHSYTIRAVYSPLYMDSEILDDLLEYVHLPKAVTKAYSGVKKSSKNDVIKKAFSLIVKHNHRDCRKTELREVLLLA
jgi:HEPN domain-containing protein